MDWDQTRDRGQRMWINARERMTWHQRQPSFGARLLALLVTALVVGLLVLLAIVGVAVGLVVLLAVGVAVLIRRAWRGLTEGFGGARDDAGRENVRVVRRQ